jgi:hypothetical protein
MEEDTSTSHTDQASPRGEEQCIATLSINSSSIPRSLPQTLPRHLNPSTPQAFEDVPSLSIDSSSIPRSLPQALPRHLNPSTPRAFEDVPRWQGSFDNLPPRSVPTTIGLLPAEEVDPRTVPRYYAPVSISNEEHYTLSSSPPSRSYVEPLRQDIDPRTGSNYQLSSSRDHLAVNPRKGSTSVYLSSSGRRHDGKTDSIFTSSYKERRREDVDNDQSSNPQLKSDFLNIPDKELEAPCESQPVIGCSRQADLPQPRHLGPDIVSKHEESHQASASQRSANKIQGRASTPIPSGRARDSRDSLDASSCGNQDQQSLDSDHSQLLNMPVCLPDSRRSSPSVLNSMEDTDRDSLRPPKDHVGQFIVNNSNCPAMPRPPGADIIPSRITMKDMPQDELAGPLQVSAEPVRIQMGPGSFNSGNIHSNDEGSASQSTLPEMELQMTELGDALCSVSTSNMSSAEVTEATDSENPSSDDEHDQMSFPAGPLKRHLTARLVAGWLCDSILIEFHNLANNFQRCPPGSGTGEAGRIASKRSLMDPPHQSNNNSSGAETGDESDQERDDHPRRPRGGMQKADGSSTKSPRLLACPFHKMNPIRYSGLNEREKEYRKCSSGYWPDISRLK